MRLGCLLNRTLFVLLAILGQFSHARAETPVWTLISQTPGPTYTLYGYQGVVSYIGELPYEYFNLEFGSLSEPVFSGSNIGFVMPPLAFPARLYFQSHQFDPVHVTINASNPVDLFCTGNNFPVPPHGGSFTINFSGNGLFPVIQCFNQSSTEPNAISVSITYDPANPPPTPEPSPTPSPIPSSTPEPTPEPTPTPIAQYTIELYADGRQVLGPLPYVMQPSELPTVVMDGCAAGRGPTKKQFYARCRNSLTGEYSSECVFIPELSAGTYNGGHNHGEPPLGEISFDNSVVSLFTLEASEFSQSIVLTVEGIAPDGGEMTPLLISINYQENGSDDWVPLSSRYVDVIINRADDHPSHATGYFGNSDLAASLGALSDRVVNYITAPNSIPQIRSEGASLRWGGLYDIHRDWRVPHCGHRDGKTIDLSLSGLTRHQKDAIATAANLSNLEFRVVRESPSTDGVSHWHATLEK